VMRYVAPQEEVKLPETVQLKLNHPSDSVMVFDVDIMTPSPPLHV